MKKNSWIVNGLSGLGLLCFIWFLYLMFFGSIKDDNIILFLITCVGVLLFPISVLYKNGIETVEIKKGVIIAVCSLLVNIILIFFTSHKGTDFIDKLFLTLTSEPYRWLYLIMLVIAGVCVIAKNKIGVWLTAILLGIIAPAIIAAVLYVILLVIAIIFVLLFGSKGSSSSLSSSANNLSSDPPDSSNSSPSNGADNTSYYTFFIVWNDGVHAPYSCYERYPRDVSASKVASDLKKKFGARAQLIDFHINDPSHDSVLNYM